jgi:type I restriction enzyme M protein
LALTASETIRNHAAFIWSVADLLRGDYKQSEYGRVILPLVVLRRLDCVLEPTKEKVLRTAAQRGWPVRRGIWVGPRDGS